MNKTIEHNLIDGKKTGVRTQYSRIVEFHALSKGE